MFMIRISVTLDTMVGEGREVRVLISKNKIMRL